MKIELEPTGERVIEDAYRDNLGGYVIYLMHIASYEFARHFCSGKKILDLGCGSGYGAASLANTAASIIAVDVSAEAIAYATERYSTPSIEYRKITADQPLPFADQEFDVVLSFQVIEHVSDEATYLREARRVLRPGGLMIIVTPDRTLRLLPLQKPWNRWHIREYSATSLNRTVSPWLQVESLLRMGAENKIAQVETRRYRLAKWTLLPITLPFIPELLRRSALDLVHRLRKKRRSAATRQPAAPLEFDFDSSAMQIDEQVPNPLNLVLLARRQDQTSA